MLGFESVDVHTWIALIALPALALATVAAAVVIRLVHGCLRVLAMASIPAQKVARISYLLLEVPKFSDRSQLDFSTGARGVLDKCVW